MSFYAVLKFLHMLSVVIWVGGMFFAHFALRPVLAGLEPPMRLSVMHGVLGRFFKWVAAAIAVILVSGGLMMSIAMSAGGAAFRLPLSWHLMAGLGVVMMLIFGHIRFAPYKRLGRALAAADWPAAGRAAASVRKLVAVNLALGILVVAVIMLG